MKDKLAQLIHECEVECLKANLHFSPERIAAYLIEKGAYPQYEIHIDSKAFELDECVKDKLSTPKNKKRRDI